MGFCGIMRDNLGLCGIIWDLEFGIWDYVGLCRISFLFRLLTKEYAPRTLRVSSRFFPRNARTIDKSRLVKADLNASLKGASEQNTTQEREREHFTQENISKQEEYFTFTKHKHNTTQGEIIKTEPESNGFAIFLLSNQILHMN